MCQCQAWFFKPIILALWRQRQKDHGRFEACLVYIASSRPARATGYCASNKQASKQTAYLISVILMKVISTSNPSNPASQVKTWA